MEGKSVMKITKNIGCPCLELQRGQVTKRKKRNIEYINGRLWGCLKNGATITERCKIGY